jgi:hypothetical protein
MKAARRSSLGVIDATHLRGAELWLEVGEPERALAELQHLTTPALSCDWAAKVLTEVEEAFLTDLSVPYTVHHEMAAHGA